MEKVSTLKNLENEYSLEVKSGEVTLEELKSLGLSVTDLKSEIFLRNTYGDSLILNGENENSQDEISGDKLIEKIKLEDIDLNRSLTSEFEKIEQDEFNSALEAVIAKAKSL